MEDILSVREVGCLQRMSEMIYHGLGWKSIATWQENIPI